MMIKYKWWVDRFFGGHHEGVVEAIDREEALVLADEALDKSGYCTGGNVKTDTLRLTHQLRPGKKKWQRLPGAKQSDSNPLAVLARK